MVYYKNPTWIIQECMRRIYSNSNLWKRLLEIIIFVFKGMHVNIHDNSLHASLLHYTLDLILSDGVKVYKTFSVIAGVIAFRTALISRAVYSLNVSTFHMAVQSETKSFYFQRLEKLFNFHHKRFIHHIFFIHDLTIMCIMYRALIYIFSHHTAIDTTKLFFFFFSSTSSFVLFFRSIYFL